MRPFAIVTLAGCIITWSFGALCAADFALASAPQTAPDAPHTRGCSVILPDPGEHESAALQVRTVRPLSECDGSAPVSYGASIRDSYTGRAR